MSTPASSASSSPTTSPPPVRQDKSRSSSETSLTVAVQSVQGMDDRHRRRSSLILGSGQPTAPTTAPTTSSGCCRRRCRCVTTLIALPNMNCTLMILNTFTTLSALSELGSIICLGSNFDIYALLMIVGFILGTILLSVNTCLLSRGRSRTRRTDCCNIFSLVWGYAMLVLSLYPMTRRAGSCTFIFWTMYISFALLLIFCTILCSQYMTPAPCTTALTELRSLEEEHIDPVEESADISIPVEEGADVSIPVEEGADVSIPVEEGADVSFPILAQTPDGPNDPPDRTGTCFTCMPGTFPSSCTAELTVASMLIPDSPGNCIFRTFYSIAFISELASFASMICIMILLNTVHLSLDDPLITCLLFVTTLFVVSNLLLITNAFSLSRARNRSISPYNIFALIWGFMTLVISIYPIILGQERHLVCDIPLWLMYGLFVLVIIFYIILLCRQCILPLPIHPTLVELRQLEISDTPQVESEQTEDKENLEEQKQVKTGKKEE